MRILILGGGAFVGRAIVTDLLAAGHELTLFSRGTTGTDLFPGVPRLLGDRDTGDYSSLAGSHWEAVVDVSGYVWRHVQQALDVLDTDRYLFISTGAVYQLDGVGPDNDESTPLRAPNRDADDVSQLTDDTYGPAKVACEQEIFSRFKDKAVFVRLGKVAGPHDVQSGLTDWVRAVLPGGKIDLPGDPAAPVQLTDVRDAAVLVRRLLEDGGSGAYNAVGKSTPIAEVIETCATAAGTTVEIVSVPDGRAPLVLPGRPASTRQRSAARAHAAGMPSTPLLDTATAILATLH